MSPILASFGECQDFLSETLLIAVLMEFDFNELISIESEWYLGIIGTEYFSSLQAMIDLLR